MYTCIFYYIFKYTCTCVFNFSNNIYIYMYRPKTKTKTTYEFYNYYIVNFFFKYVKVALYCNVKVSRYIFPKTVHHVLFKIILQ